MTDKNSETEEMAAGLHPIVAVLVNIAVLLEGAAVKSINTKRLHTFIRQDTAQIFNLCVSMSVYGCWKKYEDGSNSDVKACKSCTAARSNTSCP